MPRKKTAAAEPTAMVEHAPSVIRKIDTVITLLRRPEGATLAELVDATDWLPHTTRAALTGLRKKGHAVERRKRGEVSCYHLEG